MTTNLQPLLKLALTTQKHAYAPYSNFAVGAAILSADGQLFGGCNVENTAYGLTQCAEASAIGAMISAGQRTLHHIVIVGPATAPLITPCGSCRQQIAEFADLDTRVHLATAQGIQRSLTIAELLPYCFGPKHLS